MQNQYKRQFREPSEATKMKMSQAQKGRPKSEIHKQRISQGMIDYWSNVENRPTNGV